MKTLFLVAAFAAGFWGARWALGLPHMLSNDNVSTVARATRSGTVTQDFNGYTPGASLAAQQGWTVPIGSFATVATGAVWSDLSGYVSIAGYAPFGFVNAQNYSAEVTFQAGTGGGNASQGVMVALQPDGSNYHLVVEPNGTLLFGHTVGLGTVGADYLTYDTLAGSIPAGTKLRLTVSGTGATRVCKAEYNAGGGWITPPGWDARDFGAGNRLDGGIAGIAGYNNGFLLKIDSLTITNQ